jgi:hypothetical protein
VARAEAYRFFPPFFFAPPFFAVFFAMCVFPPFVRAFARASTAQCLLPTGTSDDSLRRSRLRALPGVEARKIQLPKKLSGVPGKPNTPGDRRGYLFLPPFFLPPFAVFFAILPP